MDTKMRITFSLLILFFLNSHLSQAQFATLFSKKCTKTEQGKDLNFCPVPKYRCPVEESRRRNLFKLIRLDGIKTNHVQEVNLGEHGTFRLITKAMKPLIFEIPNFLTDKECDLIIKIAQERGLHTSHTGFNKNVYEGDLKDDLEKASKREVPIEWRFARNFTMWDRNQDGKIDTKEIADFSAQQKLVLIIEEDIPKMFEKLGFNGCKDGAITERDFQDINISMLLTYLDYMKKKHPRYRVRYSEQANLPQNTTSHPVLRKLHERVIQLTKLPRKIVQGGEFLQVVRYGLHGHYHAHYDSMATIDEKTKALSCCHQTPAFEKQKNGCRICRFITILYYLNHVEQGGETAFIVADNKTLDLGVLRKAKQHNPADNVCNLSINCRKANLVVSPKKGSAIMWYNHFIDEQTGWLGDLDPYSVHGGCDVIKGEKWIANNWLTAPPAGRVDVKSVFDVGF